MLYWGKVHIVGSNLAAILATKAIVILSPLHISTTVVKQNKIICRAVHPAHLEVKWFRIGGCSLVGIKMIHKDLYISCCLLEIHSHTFLQSFLALFFQSYLLQMCACMLSHFRLCAIACHAPLSMRFSRHEYWSGLPFPTSGKPCPPRDRTRVSCIGRQICYHCTTWEAHLLQIPLTNWQNYDRGLKLCTILYYTFLSYRVHNKVYWQMGWFAFTNKLHGHLWADL